MRLGWPKTSMGWVIFGATLVYVSSWMAFIVKPQLRDQLQDIPIIGPIAEIFFVAYFVVVALWLFVTVWSR